MTQSLKGLLFEEDRPVADARVRLKPGNGETTTDAAGEFGFHHLETGRYQVSANKDDLFAGPSIVTVEPGSAQITLRMHVGATLTVIVSGERGVPIANAKVILDHVLAARSDAKGVAIVRGLAPGSHSGWVLADGCADQKIHLTLNDDPGGMLERSVRVEPGARIEGCAIDAAGQPVSGAWVFVMRAGLTEYEAITGPDGKWFAVVRAGAYLAYAQKDELSGNAEFEVSDVRAPQSGIDLQLASTSRRVPANTVEDGPRRIAGVVVDDAGKPVNGARISVAEPSQRGRSMVMNSWSGKTDVNGRFDVIDLDAPEYDIEVSWAGWRDGGPSINQLARTGDTNVRVVLPSGGSVSGRVICDSAPMTYFGVGVFGRRVTGFRGVDGRFLLPHLSPGSTKLEILGPGTRRTIIDVDLVNGQRRELGDIHLVRGQHLEGRVRDRAGNPISGARVIVGRSDLWADASRLQQWFRGRYETLTDDNGAYSFDGIDAHGAQLRNPQIWAAHDQAGVSVIDALPTTDGTLDFTLLGAGHINGVIEGLKGARAPIVANRPGESMPRLAMADKDGRFEFSELPPGDYVVRLNLADRPDAFANVTVVDDATTSATILTSVVSVGLTVIVPSGRGSDLRIEPTGAGAGLGSGMRGLSREHSADHVRLEFVRPGDYRVSIDGATWIAITVSASPERQSIDVRPAGTT